MDPYIIMSNVKSTNVKPSLSESDPGPGVQKTDLRGSPLHLMWQMCCHKKVVQGTMVSVFGLFHTCWFLKIGNPQK